MKWKDGLSSQHWAWGHKPWALFYPLSTWHAQYGSVATILEFRKKKLGLEVTYAKGYKIISDSK
jgi:hypothetical protein